MNTTLKKRIAIGTVLTGFLLGMSSTQARETDILPTPKAPDTAVRVQAFTKRNAPANIEALAKELAAILKPDTPAMAPFREKMATGQYSAALEVFRDATLEHLKTLKLRNPDSGETPVEALMRGVFHALDDSEQGQVTIRARIGGPGEVNWAFDMGDAESTSGHVASRMHMLNVFHPLLAEFIETGDQKYLDRWCGYLEASTAHTSQDIWREKENGGPDLRMPSLFLVRRLNYLTQALAQLSRRDRSTHAALDPAACARLVLLALKEQAPSLIAAAPTMSSNQAASAASSLGVSALAFPDFKIAEPMMTTARKTVEYGFASAFLPDGTDMERSPNYNHASLGGLARLMEATNTPPEWATSGDRLLWLRARFLGGHLFPSGQAPRIAIQDLRDQRPYLIDRMKDIYPKILEDPDYAAIMKKVFDWGTGPDTPSFYSEWYPYGGFAYIREGWDVDDQNLVMTSSRKVYGKMQEDANGIHLYAFGQDLLADSGSGKYSLGAYDLEQYAYLMSSKAHNTVLVDGYGQQQNNLSGEMMGQPAYRTPLKFRWLNSPAFNLIEGEYSDPYGTCDAHKRHRKTYDSVTIEGVRHRRQVVFVRHLGLWVVVDRLFSPEKHTYTQTWNFPAKVDAKEGFAGNIPPIYAEKGYFPGFTPDQVAINAAAHRIETRNPEDANITIYNFSDVALDYAMHAGEMEPEVLGWYSPWVHDTKLPKPDVHVSWAGEGDSLLLSLLHPRRTKGEALADVTPRNSEAVYGFEAKTKDGATLRCAAAADGQAQTLQVGDLEAEATLLLLVERPGGAAQGIALDCKVMLLAGKPVATDDPDFEFAIEKGALRKIGYVRVPVDPPVIAAVHGASSFADHATVELSCPDRDVEIRYSVDGTLPDAKSPRYEKPLTLTQTTTVRARTYRMARNGAPLDERFIDVSPIVEKTFTREPALEQALALPATGRTPPGKHWMRGFLYRVYQADHMGDSPRLLQYWEDFPVIEKGIVNALFGKGGKLRTVLYEGYLEVPREGIYTISCPIRSPAVIEVELAGRRWDRDVHGDWSLPLKAGLYPLTVRVTTRYHNAAPDLLYSGPGIEKRKLDGETVWCRDPAL